MHPGADPMPSDQGPIASLPGSMATRRTQLTDRWHWLVIIVLAALPVITMAMYVIRASPLQFNDYWDILPRVTNPDGSFSPRGALTFQNEHPVVLPGFIYWVNAKLTGGSNNVLGLYVVAVGITTLVVMVRALPSDIKADRALRGTFVVLLAALLFAPRGIHNFVFAMSGTAWLTANALACVAILVAWRRNPYAALPFAALAALSYGTGLATFPVLVLIAVLQQRPRLVVGILAAATVLAAGLYLSQYEAPPWVPGGSQTVVDVLRRSLQVLGSPFAHELELAALVGALLPCVAGVAIAAAHRQGRLAELAPWIGIIAYGMAGSLLIGWSRGVCPTSLPSAAATCPSVFWRGPAPSCWPSRTFGRSRSAIPILAAAALIAFVGGQKNVTAVVETRYYSNELAIVLRIGAEPSGDSHFSTGAIPAMRQLDHYPFNDDFDLDCGMLGEHIDTDALTGPSRSKRMGSTAGWRRSATGPTRTPRRSKGG